MWPALAVNSTALTHCSRGYQSKFEHYLFHVFITQSESFEQRKKYIKDDQELLQFNFNENYLFVSQDDFQSDHL